MISPSIIEEFLNFSNFQQAWFKVSNKQGCAGIDQETIEQFALNWQSNLLKLKESVAEGSYQPSPYKQVFIPKKKDSWRELRIPTVRDRIVQQALLNILTPLVESSFSDASFAYLPNLSYLNAVEKVADWRDAGYQWVLDADIVQFFDSINHQKLLLLLRKYIDHPGILCLIKSWLSVGVLTDTGVMVLEKGIAQGAVISPLLANIYLHEFDEVITSSDVKLVRYADDFVVLAKSKERIIKAYTEVSQILQSLELELHSEKTQITNFERGFQFLGHGFLGRAGERRLSISLPMICVVPFLR